MINVPRLWPLNAEDQYRAEIKIRYTVNPRPQIICRKLYGAEIGSSGRWYYRNTNSYDGGFVSRGAKRDRAMLGNQVPGMPAQRYPPFQFWFQGVVLICYRDLIVSKSGVSRNTPRATWRGRETGRLVSFVNENKRNEKINILYVTAWENRRVINRALWWCFLCVSTGVSLFSVPRREGYIGERRRRFYCTAGLGANETAYKKKKKMKMKKKKKK